MIANDTVLTAAHCVDPRMGGFPFPILHIGRTCTSCDNEFGYRIANTAGALMHPSWSGNLANGGDLAYIRLDRQLPNAAVLRVRPQFGPEKFGSKTLGFAGWGLTGLNQGLPGQLQEADLPYVKPEECDSKYKSFKFQMPAPEEKMCAGGKGVEACSGDSGGPLILKGKTWQTDLGVGVLSAGSPGCGVNVELPALFTRLASYREFTRDVLGRHPMLTRRVICSLLFITRKTCLHAMSKVTF